MIRKVVQVVVMLGLVAACGRDKPDSLEQQNADSAARDTTGLAAAPAPSASKSAPPAGGTSGAAKPSTPTGAATSQPTGAANPPATPPEPELVSARRLWTVQVGSFAEPQNAEAMRARLERLGVPAWTSTTTIGGQPMTRVRIGVATNTADVQAIGVKIRTNYGWNTWLAMVEDRTAVPPNGLSATRAYLAAP